jgi:hypothetical protein
MPPAAYEPATPTTKRPQTYALDRAVTGTPGPINDDISNQLLSVSIIFSKNNRNPVTNTMSKVNCPHYTPWKRFGGEEL